MASGTRTVKLKGKPLTLMGGQPPLGRKAPDVTLLDNDLSAVKLSAFAGKVVILSVVPSLDTPTCNLQTRRFDREAGKFADDLVVVAISMDLPFAQKRWSEEAEVDNIVTLSDHRDAAFGKKYGVLIRELRLLARSVFVIAADGRLMYRQLVPEVSQEPDYDEVWTVVHALRRNQAASTAAEES